jgi:hypothetical protein
VDVPKHDQRAGQAERSEEHEGPAKQAQACGVRSRFVLARISRTPAAVAARAAGLRKKGVALRRFRRGRREADVEGLNALLKELGAYEEPQRPPLKRKTAK